jgi:hypothetical protein
MKKLVAVAAFAVLSLFAVENRAHAANQATGYVCYSAIYPGASALGTAGYLNVTIYSAPSCGGSYLGTYNFCSTGANSSTCTPWPYTESQINSLAEGLRKAASLNLKVSALVYNGNPWLIDFFAAGY